MLWIIFILGIQIEGGWLQDDHQEPLSSAFPDELQNYLGVPDYDIVYLPPVTPPVKDEFLYDLTIFGNKVNLKLRPNEHLLAPNFKVIIRDEVEGDQEISGTSSNCHYLHQDGSLAAALSFCGRKQTQGIILLPNDTIEIHPLPENLHAFLKNKRKNFFPHVIKRTPFIPDSLTDDGLQIILPKNQRMRRQHSRGLGKKLTIESALFFDEAGYNLFAPYFDYKDGEMVDMLLAYMNAEGLEGWVYEGLEGFPLLGGLSMDRKRAGTILKALVAADLNEIRAFRPQLKNSKRKWRCFLQEQRYYSTKTIRTMRALTFKIQALYHHPSLKQRIDIVLVKMELFKKQPSDLPHFNGERSLLLDSFCAFNQKHNPKGDNNPQHWDMGLYVSGLDFFAYENGRKSGVTMGLATVGGVCMDKYNCVIAELGTTNVFGKPYPSAGFTSVYILAHEIGHNIGMHHDSTGNSCPKEGYIMSPSRGTNGETLWSPCSADVVRSMSWAKCLEDVPPKPPPGLDHTKYENQPGQYWGAKKQCEILLRDKDAELYNPARPGEICQNLQCKTPHRSGFYFAGPALEGTTCGGGKWCQGGSCVTKKQKTPMTVVKGGWSDWEPVQECSSACLQKSMGFQPRRRTCTNPKPVNTDEGCEGPGYEVITCRDDKLCHTHRRSIVGYATIKCKQFSKLLPDLDKNASGLQATYESGRLWMSCAIFCKRKNYNSYYTPRFDLNDLNVDPYFPDGTWCHNDGQMNYYCLQHHCLPENFKITKGVFISEDVPIPQNAQPRIHPLSDDILKYFSVDLNKKPLLTTLKPDTKGPMDDEWTDDDYIEIPEFRNAGLISEE